MKKFFKNRFFREYYDYYISLRFLVWYIFINEFLFEFFLLEGESMLPTFNTYGEIVVLDKFFYKFSRFKLKKDDLVCSINPIKLDSFLCKRIIKVEGDEIYDKNDDERSEKIKKNYIWIEGDNKDNSTDSRKFGPIHNELIRGRILLQVWPNVRFFGI